MYRLLILFSLLSSCQIESDESLVTINVPDVYVRMDDKKLELKDSVYYYQGEKFSGHLNQSSSEKNKLDYRYKNGVQAGLQQGWHVNGNLSFSYSCVDGKRQGEYKEYYPNGELQIHREYHKGSVVKNKIIDANGVVIAHYIIKDGRTFGLLGSSSCISLNPTDKI